MPFPSFLTIQTQTGWGQTLARFAAWCNPQPGWLALDLGCGPGLLPSLLSRYGCTAIGIDLSLPALLPQPLHPLLAAADAALLPFPAAAFHLVTASNLLFLLPDPLPILLEARRTLHPGGFLCLLNPSERMSVAAALALAEQRNLQGAARDSLLNWASRAEAGYRWDHDGLQALLASAGLTLLESELQVGPGLARFARGTRPPDGSLPGSVG